jgi:hypothetical protein
MVTAASEMELFLPKSYDIFWSLVILIIIAVFFYKFFLPKLQAVFDERAAKIEGGIAKAEQAQKDADEAKAKYDAQLSNARVEASKIRDDARALATAQGLASSGRYISSFRSAEGEPRVLPGEYPNPRRTAIVYNDTPYAATLERGRKGENGHYILTRASEPYHIGGV